MDISLFGKYRGNHGPSRVTEGITRGLIEDGHDVTVYTYGDLDDSPAQGAKHIRIADMPESVRGWLNLYKQVSRKVDQKEQDVFHALERYPYGSDVRTVQWTSDMVTMWRRTGKRPSIRVLGGEVLLNYHSMQGARKAGVIIAQSPETVTQMRQYWQLSPERVIPLGIEEEFLSEPGLVHDPPRILIVGRLDLRKGQKRVLKYLDPSGNDYEVRIVGGKANKEYAEMALDGWHDQYLGYLSDPELENEYEAADIIIVPSYLENFSMVGLEALAKGSLLIITSGCGLAQFDWATDENGIFVVNDGREIVEVLNEIINEEEISNRQQKAYAQASKLRWSNICAEYVQIYKNVSNSRNYEMNDPRGSISAGSS